MKIRVVLIFGAVVASLAAAAILGTFCWWPNQSAGLQLVARTREALHREGFKTDLSQFDFSTAPELRAREAALTALDAKRSGGLPREWPDLAETITDGSRIVVWQQDMLKWPHELRPGEGDQLAWDEFCEPLQDNRAALDAACTAALASPIRFDLDAHGGAAMRLLHLAVLKSLTQATSSRAMIALHNGNLDEAWTNLLAETRLVTAWEPEPAEVSHLVRFAMTKLVFDVTWQALQTNTWSTGQLARWQTEWEGVDFLRNLPETGEFKLACDMADYDFDRRRQAGVGPPVGGSGQSFAQWIQSAWQSPAAMWSEWCSRWKQAQYWRSGQYEEECDVMRWDCDRQIELRNAVQAPTWAEMRRLPGVMNQVPFKSKYGYYSIRSRSSMRQIGMAFQMAGGGLLGHAAQAESQRRILVAALALERYRAQQGAYPHTLAALAPEYLKSEPLDFMVVQRMQCNRADDGDCLLVWKTIYESPGKHALRAGLAIHGSSPGEETIAGPPLPFVVSNLCQFSTGSDQFDPQLGAAFRLKLPEPNGQFILKCQRTNGAVIKTITGTTTNGMVNLWWDLRDEQGRRFNDAAFDSTWTITLPDSGRIQNLKGP